VDIEIQGRAAGAQAVNQVYLDTARLLTQVAPFVFADGVFAMKGGTAINLFVRDMPRLSVDIDLVFVDYTLGRDEALAAINQAIRGADERLKKRGFQTHVTAVADAGETKIFIRRDKLEVKVEVNFVLRGTLHPVRAASLTPKAKEILLADMELPLVSLEDLYGGKLVAALDRQHPRDLFDVMQLFQHEGITPAIRRSFVVYLASHNRPIHEVLAPALRDISGDYDGSFRGMTTEPVALEALLAARTRMIAELQAGLDAAERAFLLSIARNEPDWTLLQIGHLAQLPGIRWKLANIDRLAKSNPKKLKAQARSLEQVLGKDT
jgi:predicted nucleotidyltransferase component of viral defense system